MGSTGGTSGGSSLPTRDQIEGRRPVWVPDPRVTARNLEAANAAVDKELPPNDTLAPCVTCVTCEQLAGQLTRNLHEQEQAKLAMATNDPNAPLPEGYERATRADLERLRLVDGDTSLLELEGHPDFHAETFVRTDPATGEPSYVVGFRGTTDFIGQSPQNVGQGFGRETAYYDQAETIGTRVKASGEPTTFVGHSLGGGLASAASGASGLPAQTFNSAGLSGATLDRVPFESPDLVNSTHVHGDILSGGQDSTFAPKAYGTRRSIPPARNAPEPPHGYRLGDRARRGINLHWMESVKNALGEEENNIRLEMRLLGC